MKEFSAKISYLEKNTNFSSTKSSRFMLPRFFTHPNHQARSLTAEKDTLLFTANEPRLLGIRSLLEELKRGGFIRHYGEGPIHSDYPKFHYFGINYIIDRHSSSETQLSWGYCLPGGDVEVAISKALGESLERQASYYIQGSTTTTYPKPRRGDASFLYELSPKFSAEQIHNESLKIVKRKDDLTDVLGFKAKSLTGDKDRFLPFEVFYWGQKVHPDQKVLFHPTSSGSGGGVTRAQAVLSGWYELIERDHLLLYWLSGVQPNCVDTNTLPDTLREYVSVCMKKFGLEVYFLDLRYDIDVLVGACVIIDPVLNRISMGAKAGIEAEKVWTSSLLEAMAVLNSTRSRDNGIQETAMSEILARTPFTSPISRSDRVNLYCSPAGISIIKKNFLQGKQISGSRFFINKNFDTDTVEIEHLKQEFKRLCTEKGAGYHAYVHTYSSEWLKKLNYHATHVFVPSLLKLHLNEQLATPVSDRLEEFAKIHNVYKNDVVPVNGKPHFFP